MTIEDSMENWKSIAGKLKDADMSEQDIGTAGQLSNAIHALDKLAFEQNLPFVFYPSEPDATHGGYEDGKYHIHVGGIHDTFAEFETNLKASWPDYTNGFITQGLIAYSRGIELVRYRAQEQLGIELFTPGHAGKIKRIPLLNKAIEGIAQLPELNTEGASKEFDAHVIGTYAAMTIYQYAVKSVRIEWITAGISDLAKLDVGKLL